MSGTKRALLATVLVNVTDAVGQIQTYRALLDPGADVSCVSEKCVQLLGIRRRNVDVEFSGIGASSVGRTRGEVKLSVSSRCDPHYHIDVDAYVFHRVTGDLPKIPCKTDEISPYMKLPLADPEFFKTGAIDILLGADVFFDSLRSGQMRLGENLPVAHETTWGWIVGGICPSQGLSSATVNHVRCDEAKLDNMLAKFWAVEEVLPHKQTLTAEEKQCEVQFMETTTRDETGRFVVDLPFKLNHPRLGASRDIAVKRLMQMERVIARKPEVQQKYIEFMNEYKSLGHMELVSPLDLMKSDSEVCYIPHHAIVTSKFRVVFDASSKTSSGFSLNDALMTGPKLQDDLFVILVRFRMFLVAFTADIVKMFRQIWITPKHRDFQRIVWRDSPDRPIEDFRLTTVTYGTSSAPYLSKRCLKLLSEGSTGSHPQASIAVGRDYYMDDLMTGEMDIAKAKILQKECLTLMNGAGMELRKWSSCSEELLEQLDPPMRAMQTPFRIDEDDVIKTLGLYWLPGPDMFWFKVTLPPNRSVITKRSICSDIARLFDPLGLLGPVTIVGKIMMQKLCAIKQDRDDPVPNDIRTDWLKYRESLPDLESIKLPRCIKSVDESYDLIGFSDASESAIAASVYLRSLDQDGNFRVRLIAAKTKVAPLQQKSLPPLELNGAVLLANLLKTVSDAFIKQPRATYAFTDSTVVLAWLKEHPKHWDTYVANRVSAIQDILAYEFWHHVPGTLNPADCASRGILPSELVHLTLWWNGPGYLKDPHFEFIKSSMIPADTLLEKRKKSMMVNHVHADITILHKFSSLTKLQRVTSYCFRFLANAKQKKETRNFAVLTSQEIQHALHRWVLIVQRSTFVEEMQLLSEKKLISVKSKLRSLNPFLDQDGLLRVGGRLEHANMAEGRKHPIILPRSHVLTTLIINHEHVNNLHGGCQLVLASMQRRFWVVNGRDAVRREIRKYVRCYRFWAETATQMMADLPSVHVTQTRAFRKVGVDFAGPLTLRKGKGIVRQKGYIAIFICMVTRAVHLEVVTSLSTQAFIAVLKRFTSRRGVPSDIYSDCGRTFIGANKELGKFWRSGEAMEGIGKFMTTKQSCWHYNPPGSPHFGGRWEAAIHSVKFHLHRTLGNVIFNYEDMSTMMSQIEACLNSRPLTQISSDPNDLTALTPGHFLIGEALTAIPESGYDEVPMNQLNKWKRMQRLTQHFWNRWSREFLSRLQQRPKWLGPKKDLEIGDLVLVKEERLPPLKWKLARIMAKHPGPDGLSRVYTIKTSEGLFKRPLVKLCPLPIESTQE